MHDFRICTIAGFSGVFCVIAGIRQAHQEEGVISNAQSLEKRLLSTAYALMYDFRICVIAGFSGVFLHHHQDLLRVAISLSNHFMRSLPSECNFSISKRQLREKNITRTDVFVLSRAMR